MIAPLVVVLTLPLATAAAGVPAASPPPAASSAAAPPAANNGPPTTNEVFPFARIEHRLDNGLRVVVVPTQSPGFFTLVEVVGTGSRDEVEPGRSGYAHFFEHMMFRGTKKVPSDARVALLASLGVDDGGYTTDDYTAYTLKGPASTLPRILELEGDRFAHLEYGEEAFKTESQAVLGEYNKSFADPDNNASEVLANLAFDKHTYKHTTIGFESDVRAMPKGFAYARQFFQRFYTPDNVMLVAVGDVKSDDVLRLVEQHFGAWKGKRATTALADEPALKAERRANVAWKSPTQARLHVGWRVPSGVRDAKQAALTMLLQGYLFSDSSSLVQRIVLEDQLAEDVSCWWDVHKDATLFPVVVRIKDGKSADDALARIQGALDDVARGTIDEERVRDVRSHLRYALLMSLTSTDSIAHGLVAASGPAMDAHHLDRVYGALATLTPKDLQEFVGAWFASQQRAVVVLRHEETSPATPASAPKGGAR